MMDWLNLIGLTIPVAVVVLALAIGMRLYPPRRRRGERIDHDREVARQARHTSPPPAYPALEELATQARRRAMIERFVRTALQEGQLYLHYQPQYEVRSGRLRGFEAFVRWEHPELGYVEPREFIPIAEKVQAMPRIGEWVFREACSTLRQVAPAPSVLTLSVNLSAIQLLDSGFAKIVQKVLADNEIAPHRLEFEIAERELAGLYEQAERSMKRLRAIGVRLALDDCGLNVASLSRLRKLSVQTVKFANVPLGEAAEDADRKPSESLLEAICHLQCEIVAMRLETYEQLAFCKKNNCQFAQGNLLCPPVDGERLPELIAAARNVPGSPVPPPPV